MTTNIILAGVGGQGILTIAEIIAMAAMNQDLNIKQSEIHGMAQRGGAVQAHIRISDSTIYSNVIPMGQADIIISLEPMETLRYLPWLAEGGKIIANSQPVVNISNYPDLNEILQEIRKLPNSLLIDAKQIATDCGLIQASNIALLGAAADRINVINADMLKQAIRKKFTSKGKKVVDANLKVFESAHNRN